MTEPHQALSVLYLQHGWGENEFAWWNQGRANLIMDNLIAEGARPALPHRDDLWFDQRGPAWRNAGPPERMRHPPARERMPHP